MKTKLLITTAFIFLIFSVFCSAANASTIFTDDFENYELGKLGGQGGWVTTSSGIKVQNTYVKQGEKAIEMFDFYGYGVNAQKSGTLLQDGQITVYFMIGNPLWQIFTIYLKEGNNERIEVRFPHAISQYHNGTSYVDFGDYWTNPKSLQWSSIQIQWRSQDHTARYKVNQGEWTNWAPTKSAWTSGLDTVHLRTKDNILRLDAIQEKLIGEEIKNPVLIVPGLLGTEMKKGEEVLWADPIRMAINITDSFMDPLQFNDNLLPANNEVYSNDVIKNPNGLFDYTDGLITEFAGQDYIENETLFTFPYDWRYGVSGVYADGKTNVDLLAEKIDEILQQTGASQVDVVAHSLGGLLVKKYAMDNPADNNIGKAVFVGVPNTGAPKTVKALLQGDNFGVSFGPIGLNEAEMKKIAENMPASYDLLPSQEYYTDNGSFVKTINVDVGNFIYEESNLNYQESKSFLTDDHNLNSQGMQNAQALHTNSFDDFDLRTAGIDLYSINGCKSGTINKIVETAKTNIFGYTTITYDAKEGTGDGTVPLSSADNIAVDDDKLFYIKYADHGKMPSQNGIKQQIVNLISGSDLDTGNKIITKTELSQNPEQCELTGFWLKLFSPVSIEVIDENRNRVGIATDDSIQNQIPGADYQIMNDHSFVFIPTDENQNYTINLKGEDAGTFTFKNSQIINSEIVKTEVFSNLPVTPELSGKVVLSASAGHLTSLVLDTNGDGTTDQTVEPSSVLDASQSDDLLPPVSTAIITGDQGQLGFYKSDVLINITAEDDNSGVLSISYDLDGAGFQKVTGGTSELAVSEEDSHTLTYFATDNAGNNEPEKIITFTIDKTPPEAVIEFDPVAKDLKFSGTDNTAVSVSENDDTITITDQSGNTTEIQLNEKDRKRKMRAEIKELRYNSVSADISKNKMQFSWALDQKNASLKMLSQYAVSKKDYIVLARYNGRQTKIIGKDFSGKIRESFTGLKIIRVITDRGDFKWGY